MDAVGVMGMDQIDVSHIKTEMKIEPPQLANDDSMDLDPNYDPSDFLNFGNRPAHNNANDDLQSTQNHMQYGKEDDEAHGSFHTNANMPDGAISAEISSMPQMPLIMPSNDNVGIDEDLAISESDEEDGGGDGTRAEVPMKNEVFNDSIEMVNDGIDANLQSNTNEPQPNEGQINMDISKPEQNHQQDDNDDDDWLHF